MKLCLHEWLMSTVTVSVLNCQVSGVSVTLLVSNYMYTWSSFDGYDLSSAPMRPFRVFLDVILLVLCELARDMWDAC